MNLFQYFLKRFESSVAAFELSCDRLLRKLLAFLEVHSVTDAEKKRLERWKTQNADTLGYATQRQFDFWGSEDLDVEDEDIVPQEMLDAVERLDPDEFDVPEMMSESFLDLDQIVQFIAEARKFEPRHDDKLKKLIRLLKSKELIDQKVLLFTEFADTARYLRGQLERAGIEGVAQVDSATKANRADVIRSFSPYYNGSSSAELAEQGLLSARIADPHKKTVDDFAAHMRTKPFLRELMETFLKVGGWRGKAGGPGIDFDELGVSEVVELLDTANMEIDKPTEVARELEALRAELLAVPYFKDVPSMQPQYRKTAVAFHAKDDLPEIRREVFKLLLKKRLRFYAVVRDKRDLARSMCSSRTSETQLTATARTNSMTCW